MSKKELKGYVASGLLYIGDPSYLSHGANDFEKYEEFIDEKGPIEGDLVLDFGGFSENNTGKGILVDVNRISGKYYVTYEKDEAGRVKSIKINVQD